MLNHFFAEVFMNVASLKACVFALSSVFLAATAAQASSDESGQITMHSEIVDTPLDVFTFIDRVNVYPEASAFTGETMSVDIDTIINIAQKTWDIIKANAPVAQVKFNFANALPRGVTDSGALAGFSDLQSKSVRLWGTNMWGATVYDVTLTAVHQYGGQFEGKGQYLETVSVIPSNLNVLWGYTVDYSVENVTTTNGGTTEDPVAKMALHAKFKVETVLQRNEINTLYQFSGDSSDVKTSGF
jgi:hypothetical protein